MNEVFEPLLKELNDLIDETRKIPGQCEAIAILIMAELQKKGIPNKIVKGELSLTKDNVFIDEIYHFWNEIEYDGKIYFIDLGFSNQEPRWFLDFDTIFFEKPIKKEQVIKTIQGTLKYKWE